MRWMVRIKGTINDEIEVEADSADEAEELARDAWRYVEFEDLWVANVSCLDRDYEEPDDQ